jgi:protein phosphatase
MTDAEARESPHRNILTHALGHKPTLDAKMPSVFEITLLPEDHLLICTDGFFDVVPDDDLLAILLKSPADAAAQQLVETAVERGASDNVSAVVAAVQPARDAEPSPVGAAERSSYFLQAIAILVLIAVLAAAVYYFAM